MSEDIYIVAARRTPIGSFQGALSALSAPQLGAAAAQAAIKDSGIDAAQIDEIDIRLRADGRHRPGARAPGGARGRRAAESAGDYREQDVRLRPQGRDAGCGPDWRRLGANRARGRHRVDVERSLPAAESARRLAHGARAAHRSHVLRRPAEPVRRQHDGLLRGRDFEEVRLHARPAGRIRGGIRATRADCSRERLLRCGGRRRHRARIARASASWRRTKRRSRATSRRFPR